MEECCHILQKEFRRLAKEVGIREVETAGHPPSSTD